MQRNRRWKKITEDTILPGRVVRYATPCERLGATIIDNTLILFLSTLLLAKLPLLLSFIVTAWLYEAIQIAGKKQATIGQRIMGVKVSTQWGDQCDFLRASVRHVSKYISLLTLASGYIILFLDPKHQSLHDKIAQTYVVTSESFHAAL